MNVVGDVLEHIVSFVDSPQDLLSLAMASKQLESLIIPYHLHLRRIRCDPVMVSLWLTLSNKPAFCQRIRYLELVPSGSHGRPQSKIPSFLVEQGEIEEVGRLEELSVHVGSEIILALISSIRHMTYLRRFCWVDMRVNDTTDVAALFTQLNESCPLLDEIEMDSDTQDPVLNFNTIGSAPWQISDLSSISLAIKLPTDTSLIQEMVDMLLYRCPNLQELALLFFKSSFQVTPIFSRAYWPFLRRFTLVGDLQFDNVDALDGDSALDVSEFWTKHRRLECLFFLPWNPEGPRFMVYPGCLPRIRSLSIYHRFHQPLSLPWDVVQRIQYFCLFIYDDSKRDMIIDALQAMTSLRDLIISRWPRDHLGSLARVIPQIRRLKFIRPIVSSWGNFEDFSKLHLESIQSLSHLTHLSGLAWVKTADRPPTSLFADVAANPTLQFVAITPMSHKDVWYRLRRNTDGNYIGWDVEEDSYDLNWKLWGDIMHGLVPTMY